MTATDTTEAASTEDAPDTTGQPADNDGSTEEPQYQTVAEGDNVPRRKYNNVVQAYKNVNGKIRHDAAELKRRFDEMERIVEGLTTKVDDLSSNPTATSNATDLEKKVKKLTTRVANLEAELETIKADAANLPASPTSATKIEQLNKLIEAAVLAFADSTVVTTKFMLDGQFERVTRHMLANSPIPIADLVDGSDAIFQAVASVMVTEAVNVNKSATPPKDPYVVAQVTLAAIKYNLGSTDPSNPGQLVKLAVDHGNS